MSNSPSILLLGINARYTHTNLALRYARNQLDRDAPQVKTTLIECTINQPYLDILEQVIIQNPTILVCSVYIWSSELFASLFKDLQLIAPECLIVAGGPELSMLPQPWLLNHPNLSMIACCSAETAMNYLAVNDFRMPPERVLNIASIPFNQVASPWTQAELSQMEGRYLYYESGRGCPFACTYCISGRDDQSVDLKPLETVVAELQHILATRPLMIKFVDRTFNANPRRARAIWTYLRDWSLEDAGVLRQKIPAGVDSRRKPIVPEPTKFHFEIQSSLLVDADFELLTTIPPGIFQFEMGIQTTSTSTLEHIRRKVPWQATKTGIQRLLALGTIHGHVDMIIGLPDESLGQIANSFDQIIELDAPHFQIGFLKSLAGTVIHQEAEQKNMVFSQKPPYQLLRSPWLSPLQLFHLRRIEQLTEGIWFSIPLRQKLQGLAPHYHSIFLTIFALSSYTQRIEFDISTKNPSKLQQMLEGFILEDHSTTLAQLILQGCLKQQDVTQAQTSYADGL